MKMAKYKIPNKKEKIKVIINNEEREVKCNMFKLANTLWNKSGEKYTEKEMNKMGFKKK